MSENTEQQMPQEKKIIIERSSTEYEPLFDLRNPMMSPGFMLGMLEVELANAEGNDRVTKALQKSHFGRLFQSDEIRKIEESDKGRKEKESEFIEKTLFILKNRFEKKEKGTEIFIAEADIEFFERMITKIDSWRDNLTGLYTRTGFQEVVKLITSHPELMFREKEGNTEGKKQPKVDTSTQSLEKKKIQDGEVAILILDLDKFKDINDKFGHGEGDEALKRFASTLIERGVLRKTDIIVRYGGEEFVIIALNTSPDDAVIVDTKIADKVGEIIIGDDTEQRELRFSAGSDHSKTWQDLINFAQTGDIDKLIADADRAVYVSKEKGRGMITSTGL